jgi:hypothetical protein
MSEQMSDYHRMEQDALSDLSARDREAALRGALRLIAEFPIPEQDNMVAANMRRIAKEALA